MILGMKRSVFLILLLLTLLVGATFSVLIVSAMNSRSQGQAPATIPTDLAPSTEPLHPAEQPFITPSESSISFTSPTPWPSPTITLIVLTATPTNSPVASPSSNPGSTPTITLTPEGDVCAQMDVDFIKSTSTIVLFRLRNSNPFSTSITQIVLNWPEENDAVFNAILDGNVIWAGVEMDSPTEMTNLRGEPRDRSISGTHALEFFFGTPAAQRGYRLDVSFENGCVVSIAN